MSWSGVAKQEAINARGKDSKPARCLPKSCSQTKGPVTIFLVNGVKLQGVITWFDNFCLLLRRDAQSQLVYKHAISTIMPGAPIQLFDPEHPADD